ncbi:PREDICTED: replication protein A 14 kDa subunit B [Fragaria vesca subsp. vesca]|uniref:replication protein A 14 kDa subunit B n=1 Tax=Fragaria vesca subsp. vesca TaxID=101020 RepID=UPI0002C35FF4|nr:PREDICTED: replication protein A 14 kDa subunit B [Fragaria vesca subsp. vesca]
MDTSNPSVFVNAELLRLYVGRQVRALIQVAQSGAGSVIGNSTDGVQLIVKGTPPSPLTKFVEVIGIADSDKSIQASIWNNFGDTIDTHAYNQLCLLANGDFKHLFI